MNRKSAHGIRRVSAYLILMTVFLSCGPSVRMARWVSSRGSEDIPVVSRESADAAREIVLTTDMPGVDVPLVREEINAYGKMTVSVSISNDTRSQQMVEVKAKFFDYSGRVLLSMGDWEQVFLLPSQITQADFTCSHEGAVSFKILVR